MARKKTKVPVVGVKFNDIMLRVRGALYEGHNKSNVLRHYENLLEKDEMTKLIAFVEQTSLQTM